MKLLFLDFETAFSEDYSLSLKSMTTQKYIRDPRFKVHGVGLSRLNAPGQWVTGTKCAAALGALVPQSIVVCQNAAFDVGILSFHYGLRPGGVIDTESLSRAMIGGSLKSHGLDAISKLLLGIGKGFGLASSKGLWDLPADVEKKLADYCVYLPDSDIELTKGIFKKLIRFFPQEELSVVDWCARAFSEPSLILNSEVLERYYEEVKALKAKALKDAGLENRDVLMSNPQYAAALEALGVVVPTKISAATGKESFAFAKTDEGHKALLEHENPQVQALVAARLEVKSTIEETRAAKYLEASHFGPWPVHYKFSGADQTHRLSGSDGAGGNPQNLKRGGVLRDAIEAPPGHLLVVADLSQIEARITMGLAGETDALDAFRAVDRGEGQDVYCWFGEKLYGRPISKKENPLERQIAKSGFLGCIAEGELVLTDSGLVPIEQISLAHRLWDGVEWVAHEGLIFKGIKHVIEYDGLRATPDHQVHLQDGGWCGLQKAADQRASIARTGDGRRSIRFLGSAVSGNKQRRPETSKVTLPMHIMQYSSLGKQRLSKKGFVGTLQSVPEFNSDSGRNPESKTNWASLRRYCYSVRKSFTQTLPSLWRSRYKEFIYFTEGVYSLCFGEFTPQGLCRCGNRSEGQQRTLRAWEYKACDAPNEHEQQRKYADVRFQRQSSAASSSISFSSHARPVSDVRSFLHSESALQRLANYSRDNRSFSQHDVGQTARTYDIANAGPRHRFTVSGRLVHNCGFGAGNDGLKRYANGQGIVMNDEEAAATVTVYRNTFPGVCRLWRIFERRLPLMAEGKEDAFPAMKPVFTTGHEPLLGVPGFRLLDGLWVKFPNLRLATEDNCSDKMKEKLIRFRGKVEGWIFDSGRDSYSIWGGGLVENGVQFLARKVAMEKTAFLKSVLKIAMSSHDEAVAVVPTAKVETAKAVMRKVMSTSPTWWPDLPLAAEVSSGRTYGECK